MRNATAFKIQSCPPAECARSLPPLITEGIRIINPKKARQEKISFMKIGCGWRAWDLFMTNSWQTIKEKTLPEPQRREKIDDIWSLFAQNFSPFLDDIMNFTRLHNDAFKLKTWNSKEKNFRTKKNSIRKGFSEGRFKTNFKLFWVSRKKTWLTLCLCRWW